MQYCIAKHLKHLFHINCERARTLCKSFTGNYFSIDFYLTVVPVLIAYGLNGYLITNALGILLVRKFSLQILKLFFKWMETAVESNLTLPNAMGS